MPCDVHVLHACVVSIIKLLHTQSALSATEGVDKKFTFRFRSMVVLWSFYGTNRSVSFLRNSPFLRKYDC